MPSSCALRTTARAASRPSRWPSIRERPRLSAQRPLPSMMMATWRGMNSGRSRRSCTMAPLRSSSNLEDLVFLLLDQVVDLLDELVGERLDLLFLAVTLVLRRGAVALQILEHAER